MSSITSYRRSCFFFSYYLSEIRDNKKIIDKISGWLVTWLSQLASRNLSPLMEQRTLDDWRVDAAAWAAWTAESPPRRPISICCDGSSPARSDAENHPRCRWLLWSLWRLRSRVSPCETWTYPRCFLSATELRLPFVATTTTKSRRRRHVAATRVWCPSTASSQFSFWCDSPSVSTTRFPAWHATSRIVSQSRENAILSLWVTDFARDKLFLAILSRQHRYILSMMNNHRRWQRRALTHPFSLCRDLCKSKKDRELKGSYTYRCVARLFHKSLEFAARRRALVVIFEFRYTRHDANASYLAAHRAMGEIPIIENASLAARNLGILSWPGSRLVELNIEVIATDIYRATGIKRVIRLFTYVVFFSNIMR